ncbi:Nitrate/nitrite transporter NarK [Andreprevotia lacus DSM 23236]|jgi:MFS family permease|uniref:Nitrate/nitrite transporter NarK n=1 Tax=Andreprevotia lacus DSM 23236 TaxID=1121001 RepID=A0A1W1XH94_9NEIS|nr:MFS transporter [Andreprevotia lacus]SMC23144.1 Nitrate/nitrite transporter NarK [Andreprevotia lacus DSM 23236]
MWSATSSLSGDERKVILAASLGTVFEWYDFYLYGALAAIISRQFFAGVNETTGFIFALLAFAAGFAVRPLGAIVFGRLGDLIGRKHTFLATILVMGLSTAAVGFLPTYAQVGVFAPVLLIALRLLQGLALGGEYGGAVVYVAEHAPNDQRGRYTGWIQTTATFGLFLSLLVILACRSLIGDGFDEWGWRVPFLLSFILLGVSLYIRMHLQESPVFQRIKQEGRQSRAPLTEAFGNRRNLKRAFIVLFGSIAGLAAIWYTSQFYALLFLKQTLRVDPQTADLLMAAALLIGTPCFVVFGHLSDRIGRKPVILAGLLLAAVCYLPIFKALTHYANPAIAQAERNSPVLVVADPATCHFLFDPIGTARFDSACDIAKSALALRGIPYGNDVAVAGTPTQVVIGAQVIASFDGAGLKGAELQSRIAVFQQALEAGLEKAAYPAQADPAAVNKPMVLLLLTVLVVLASMTYGPLAAQLAELFPPRIRYTSMSLPYHLGYGWFGGFLAPVAFAMVARNGGLYAGLWYPLLVIGTTLLLGAALLPETNGSDIAANDPDDEPASRPAGASAEVAAVPQPAVALQPALEQS